MKQGCSGCCEEGQEAFGVKPGNKIGCCNLARRGDQSLDQVIGRGYGEK